MRRYDGESRHPAAGWWGGFVLCAALAFGGLAACPTPVPPPPPPRPPAPVEPPDDPNVQVETMGSLSHDEVRRTFQNAAPRLVGCYEQGLRRVRNLAGDVRFHVGVARDGSVKWAFVEASQLGDHAALECMLQVVRGTTFPRPRGGDTEAVFPIELDPPDAVAYPATWTPNQVPEIDGTYRPEIDACLDGSSGYTLTLYLATGGLVQEAGATPPDADHQAQADCLAAAARTWQLADPGPGGAKVTLAF
ncbi:MAG: AgmX/PglI C-terminal domain-containing protein [Deltaproteobacteria bacterium]|nr:AgmX/PglI C-terminal domain-containing protein [Deltaproteobacteria bacterium]